MKQISNFWIKSLIITPPYHSDKWQVTGDIFFFFFSIFFPDTSRGGLFHNLRSPQSRSGSRLPARPLGSSRRDRSPCCHPPPRSPPKVTGDKWYMPGDRGEVTGDRWQGTGENWPVTCDRWQVSGDRWHLTGDRWQVTGDRWQVTGVRLQVICVRWQVTSDRCQVSQEM